MIDMDKINELIHRNLQLDNCNFHADVKPQAIDFIERNYQCLEKDYLLPIKKDKQSIEFSDLKNIYLMDKEIRMYMFNVIEEIEVYLKSMLFIHDEIDVAEIKTYHNIYTSKAKYDKKYNNNPKYAGKFDKSEVSSVVNNMKKFQKNLYSQREKIFYLSFTDVSKIIRAIFYKGDGKKFLDVLLSRLEYNDHDALAEAIRDLSSLRNSLAHHDSIFKTLNTINSKTKKYYRMLRENDGAENVPGNAPQKMREVLTRLHTLNKRIRGKITKDIPSKKLKRLETIMKERTKNNPQFRVSLGYNTGFNEIFKDSKDK